jgi:peptide/nickel transport system permease protein
VARLTRAELLKIRETDYISSARSLGIPTWRVLLFHALPNALTPAMVALTFGAGSAILAESGLSFLGVGVPPGTATWGGLIAEGRQQFSAWWLVVYPGMMIFFTVLAFNRIGERMKKGMIDDR